MLQRSVFIVTVIITLLTVSPLRAEEQPAEKGTVFTFWPLVDYRTSPREHFSNLSLLGPLIKVQQQGDERTVAVRPLVYREADRQSDSSTTDYLYPIASSESSPAVTTLQVLKLYQANIYRRDEGPAAEKSTMLFPFYISGVSKKYGPYTSVFPIYGDIYERFWRDEYHYVLFPLYGRTVNKGTTTRNYLYPIFSLISGDHEWGFQCWPLYGQAEKDGVYRRRFALWPIFMQEERGLDTDNPTRKLMVLPFYAATDSPELTNRYYLWPFFGYANDRRNKVDETYYLWPFIMTARGERTVNRILPFYDEERGKETLKYWYLWPLYRHDEITSASFVEKNDRILYFLFTDKREQWPVDGKERRQMALWPLFTFDRDEHGIKNFAFLAPLEPIVSRPGIEQSWSPLWRIYVQRWNDAGDSAVSFLWNLYWHERRGHDLAYEFFPLLAYRSEADETDVRLLKGLVRYRVVHGKATLSFLWLPFGISWQKAAGTAAPVATETGGEP